MLYQAEPQTGDEASTYARSTSAFANSSYCTTHFTTSTEPPDCATTTTTTTTNNSNNNNNNNNNNSNNTSSSVCVCVCKVNITVKYPVNEMKKTLARHIAFGVSDLSKLRCNRCEIDHPSRLQHDCLLSDDILIDMHFDEAVKKVNSTAGIRDWLTLLLEVDLRQSDVAPQQFEAIKSWLEEYPSE